MIDTQLQNPRLGWCEKQIRWFQMPL